MTIPLPNRLRDEWPDASVETALQAVRLHQESIQHADMKIARLAGFQGALAALMISTAQAPITFVSGSPAAPVAGGVAVLFLLTLLVAARHLALGFQPRASGPALPNRFGFPAATSTSALAALHHKQGEPREAWTLVTLLAGIAQEKHQRVRAALPWTFAAGCAAAAWLVLTVFMG
ncbi:hypothetical protein D7147_08065 [Micromonospora musae]|uniref:Pycsar effector protein domain-containing protein n=1 Tax=Micromonospora musae TaxID=1894970 RepID=A0ABX9RIH3_9ACTN|nr:hypothetical protein [Micromonospora musae]RKN22590.1 hypothetical protein D7147_08065 [Micromonospora musae]